MLHASSYFSSTIGNANLKKLTRSAMRLGLLGQDIEVISHALLLV
jgi:hypothetical protein